MPKVRLAGSPRPPLRLTRVALRRGDGTIDVWLEGSRQECDEGEKSPLTSHHGHTTSTAASNPIVLNKLPGSSDKNHSISADTRTIGTTWRAVRFAPATAKATVSRAA